MEQSRLDHHLGGKLHAESLEAQPVDRVFAEAPQAALKVTHGAVEEHPAQPAEAGIAEESMQERHGAGTNAALEAVTHYQIVAFLEFGEEVAQMGEVVA